MGAKNSLASDSRYQIKNKLILFQWRHNRYEDLFADDVNANVPSMYSGRSVACVDRTGSGKYGILLATYAQGESTVQQFFYNDKRQ